MNYGSNVVAVGLVIDLCKDVQRNELHLKKLIVFMTLLFASIFLSVIMEILGTLEFGRCRSDLDLCSATFD